MTYIPSITDDVLAEIEAECRNNELREDGQVDGRGDATNAETLSMIRRLRESEARLWSICAARLRDEDARVEREARDGLAYLFKIKTGESK